MKLTSHLKYFANRWKKFIFERETLYFYLLELKDITSNVDLVDGLTILFAREGEGEELLCQLIPREVVNTRLREGQRCCMVLRHNKFISYCWMAERRTYIGEVKRDINLKEGDIYLYDCYTLPEERGKGLYPLLLMRASQKASHEGFRRALIFSESRNIFSRKGILKAGFHFIGEVAFCRILGNVQLRKNDTGYPIDFNKGVEEK